MDSDANIDSREDSLKLDIDRLNLENTEYDYGHNVVHVRLMNTIDHIEVKFTINPDDGTGDL